MTYFVEFLHFGLVIAQSLHAVA